MNNFSFPDSLYLSSVLSWVKSCSPNAYEIFYSLIYPDYSIGCTNPWQEIYTRSALFGNRVRFFDQRLRNLTYFFLLQSYRNHVFLLEKKVNQVLLLCNITSKSNSIDSESMTAWQPHGCDDSNSVLFTYFCSEKDIHVCLWISYATMGSIAVIPFYIEKKYIGSENQVVSFAPFELLRYPFGDDSDVKHRITASLDHFYKNCNFDESNPGDFCLSFCSEPNLGHQYWNQFSGFIDILDFLKCHEDTPPIVHHNPLLYSTISDKEYFPVDCFLQEGFKLERLDSNATSPKYLVAVDSIRPRYDNMRRRLVSIASRSPAISGLKRPHAIFLIKGNSPTNGQNTIAASVLLQVIPEVSRYLVTHFGIDLVFDGCCSPHDTANLSPNPKRDSFIARENLLYDLSCSSSSAVSAHSISIIGSPISEKIEAYERSMFVICFANSAVFLPYALQKLIVDFKPPDEYKAMFSSSANRAKDFNNELWCLVEIDYSMPPIDIIENICRKLNFLINHRRKFISDHSFTSCS